jgi:hypothetical protein
MAPASSSKMLKPVPAPASAESRATKIDRVQYLEAWVNENPLATIDEAREAVKAKFGISVGNKLISDALRDAKQRWEQQRRAAREAQPVQPVIVPAAVTNPLPPVQSAVKTIVEMMMANGIRAIEILADGKTQVQFA